MSSLDKFIRLGLIAGCLAGAIQQAAHAQSSGATSSSRRTQSSSGSAAKTSGTNPRATAAVKGAVPAAKGAAPAAKGTAKVAEAPGRAVLNDKRQAPPVAQPLRIPKLSQEMEDLLREWEEKSSKIKRLEGKFERRTFDKVFEVEQIAEGRFCFESPDRGSLHQVPLKVEEGAKGYQFRLAPGDAQRWVCTGKYLYRIDDKERQYEEMAIPKEDQGQNIRNSPLPFVFGMKAAEAKQRYDFVLVAKGTNERQVQLTVSPREARDASNYKKAEVILDRSTFIPKAVKLHDTTGNKQDTYVFFKESLAINKQGGWNTWFKEDPLNPNLASYKKIVEPVGPAGAAPGQQLAPRPVDRRSTQVPAGGKVIGPRAAPQQTAELPKEDRPPPRNSTKGKVRVSP